MADVAISALPDAGALAGTELVPVVQTGATAKTTAQAIADLAPPPAFADVTSKPTTLGGYGITDAATLAQGALADSAVQPGDLSAVATSGDAADVAIADAGGYFTGTTVEAALQEIGAGGGGGGGGVWGAITGTLADQTDLMGYIAGVESGLDGDIAAVSSALGSLTSSLADVATSGDYADLTNTPDPGIPQNSQSTAYTLVLADANKHILHPSSDTTARIFTIPANGTVAFPVGTAVTFVNQNAGGVITIAITTDTMRLAGAGTTGSRTLAANGVATALKITSTEWIISGTGLT